MPSPKERFQMTTRPFAFRMRISSVWIREWRYSMVSVAAKGL
jgi:hypothetical protein